jgi:hypothetical protein
VAAVVGGLRAPGRERDELVAHVDERHARAAAAQLEVEDRAVEVERLVDVADFQGDVVQADGPWLAGHVDHLAASAV